MKTQIVSIYLFALAFGSVACSNFDQNARAINVGKSSSEMQLASQSTSFQGVSLPAAIASVAQQNSSNSIIIPCGTYVIDGPITITSPGFSLEGINRTCVVIQIGPSFPVNAQGAIVFKTGEPGPIVKNLTLAFQQSNMSSLQTLKKYPPAIFAQSSPRFELDDILITNAWNGVDMRGNSGGARINNVSMSAYNTGIDIDGSIDSVRINDFHFWPFGGANFSLMGSNAIGINSGRNDDLIISGMLTEGKFGIHFYNGQFSASSGFGGTTSATISNTDFDTFGGIWQEDGIVQCSNCSFSEGTDADLAVKFLGGHLQISNSNFWKGVSGPTGVIQLLGSGAFQLQNSTWTGETSGDLPFLTSINSVGQLVLTGNTFNKSSNVAYKYPVINLGGAVSPRFIVSGNEINDKGSGAGAFFSVDSLQWGQIVNNILLNYSLELPNNYMSLINVSGNSAAPIHTH